MKLPKELLVDGDVIAFKAATGNQHVMIDGVDTKIPNTYAQACASADAQLKWFMEILEADKLTVFMSDRKDNFRKSVYPLYKSNRTPGERPPIIDQMKDYLEFQYDAWSEATLEGDDLLGIYSTMPCETHTRIIVSIDKDLKTIPGYLFNPGKWTEGVQHYTPEEAQRFLWYQTLCGDTVDGYPGAPGVGPKKAESVISTALLTMSVFDLWPVILKVFTDRMQTYEFALAQYNCARILKYDEYDFMESKVILWEPPKIA